MARESSSSVRFNSIPMTSRLERISTRFCRRFARRRGASAKPALQSTFNRRLTAEVAESAQVFYLYVLQAFCVKRRRPTATGPRLTAEIAEVLFLALRARRALR